MLLGENVNSFTRWWHISYRARTFSPLPASCRTNVNGFVLAVPRSGLYCAVDKELVSPACGEKAELFKVPSFAGAGHAACSERTGFLCCQADSIQTPNIALR